MWIVDPSSQKKNKVNGKTRFLRFQIKTLPPQCMDYILFELNLNWKKSWNSWNKIMKRMYFFDGWVLYSFVNYSKCYAEMNFCGNSKKKNNGNSLMKTSEQTIKLAKKIFETNFRTHQLESVMPLIIISSFVFKTSQLPLYRILLILPTKLW